MHIFKTILNTLTLITAAINVHAQTGKQPIAEGKRLYALHCANCHGANAQGATKAGFDISIITERGGKQPPDLTDTAWDHGSSDEMIFSLVKKGMPAAMMPSFNGILSDGEIRNVVGFIRTFDSSNNAPSTGQALKPATANQQTEPQSLELADYIELPISGDMTADRVTGVLARGSIMREEPATNRLFINDLNGILYIFNKQTKQLTPYLDFNGSANHQGLFPKFTASMGYAAGLMNFEFDPEYSKNGVFYTLHMETSNAVGDSALPKKGLIAGLNLAGYETTKPMIPPDVPTNARGTREMVIVEWTDKQTGNTSFEGTAREVLRMQLPGIFHPLNEITFNPSARKGDPDWRVMYLGIGDAGTGERPGPMRLYAQRLDTYQGKILRIIPMLNEHRSASVVSENGQYRIPGDNPYIKLAGAKKEIWASGLRNPHRLTWYVDPTRPREGVLLAFNIGLISWETVMIIKKGVNYGYPFREGNQSMAAGNVMGPLPADDNIPVMVTDSLTQGTVQPGYAVVQYPHAPGGGDAIANGFVYRGKRIPALKAALVFSDVTTGRIWYTNIRDVLAADDGNPLTVAPIYELSTRLRELCADTYRKRGGLPAGLPGRGAVAGAGRVDLRLAEDEDGELYAITKSDGMIRRFVSVK